MTAPNPTIAATIAQLEDLTAAVTARLDGPHPGAGLWTVEQVLGALLAGGEVREQYGARLTWPDGDVEDHWGDGVVVVDGQPRAGLDLARRRVAFHDGVRTLTTGTLVRRLRLYLAVEEVIPA